ncbi:MAG: hypothetical protein JWN79_2891 [Gemmatimonadetes bacterium]|jgi:hypothetical protein|nr:hypothetical protein [Gemmatimonadota bacterium]
MNLRRRSSPLIPIAAFALVSACVTRTSPVRPEPVPAEALTDARTIRLRCEDPEGVIAGRVFCVLKDLPRTAPPAP